MYDKIENFHLLDISNLFLAITPNLLQWEKGWQIELDRGSDWVGREKERETETEMKERERPREQSERARQREKEKSKEKDLSQKRFLSDSLLCVLAEN